MSTLREWRNCVLKKKQNIETRCVFCGKAAGGCAWASHLLPVEGWEIIEGDEKGSVVVVSCPEYEEDRPAENVSDEAIQRLIHAIVERVVRDYIIALSGKEIAYTEPIKMKRICELWAISSDAELLCDGLDVPTAFRKIRLKYEEFCEKALTHWDDTPKHGAIEFKCPMCGETACIKERGYAFFDGAGHRITKREKAAKCSCGCEYRRDDVPRKLY